MLPESFIDLLLRLIFRRKYLNFINVRIAYGSAFSRYTNTL